MRFPLSRFAFGSVPRLLLASLITLMVTSIPATAEEEHAEAEGLVLLQAGTAVVTQWDGVLTGEIEAEEGEESAPVDVYFLDADSTLFQPDPFDNELQFLNADPLALTVTKTGDWQFTVTGLEHGHVDLQVVIWHDDHSDFTSLPFEVHVEHEEEHTEAEGLVLLQAGTAVVTQWDGVLTGEIEAEEGEESAPVDVYFLDADSTLFQPDPFDNELQFLNADPLALTVTKTGDWQFTVTGLEHGHVDLQVVIWHDDHSDFTSLPFEVHVEHEEEHAEAEGLVILDGPSEVVRQWEGELTGEIAVPVASTTTLFDVWFLAGDGDEFVPEDPDFELRWTVADETIATLEQMGPWSFQIHGHDAGSTTVSLVIWHDGHADFTSAPIPVEVQTATAAPGNSLTRVALRPATPNPFTSTTSIAYTLPARTSLTVQVFDVRGRLVRTMFDGERDAGQYVEIFDGRDRANGVYFVRLTTPDRSITQKMISVR